MACKTHRDIQNIKSGIHYDEYRGASKVNVNNNDSVYTQQKTTIIQHGDTVFVYNDLYKYKYKYKDSVITNEEFTNSVDTVILEKYIAKQENNNHSIGAVVVLICLVFAVVFLIGVKFKVFS